MGDAGPLEYEARVALDGLGINDEHTTPPPPLREVTVLVTGFGPFKTFTTNPSYLIAASLPAELLPLPPAWPDPKSSSIGTTTTTTTLPLLSTSTSSAYKIRIITHPSPIRVSYATVSSIIPDLISVHDPDYILHIGMAGGREHYTLETTAHRDHYKIKDVDERDGWREGEVEWKSKNVPETLFVGWDGEDVLGRWDGEVGRWRDESDGVSEQVGLRVSNNNAPQHNNKDKDKDKDRAVVRLSRDAGRFLCEFALMTSLARRWVDGQKADEIQDPERQGWSEEEKRKARERVGKVAFLHVPGGYALEELKRGSRVAEAAIRAIVASWEDGRRKKEGDELLGVGGRELNVREGSGRWEGVVWRA